MSTWTIRRVGDMARLINGHPFDSDDFTPTGDVPLVRIRDITAADFETYVPQHTVPQDKVLKDGDVVIGMDGDFNVIRWHRGAAALNQRVCALRDTGVSDLRFLAYALPDHLKVINDLTYSTTVKHLSSGQVTGLRITAPDRDDQGRIADYLDRETATIDALIEKQRRMVRLLEERRYEAIADALNPARETDATNWWGSGRAHWISGQVSRLASVSLGKMLQTRGSDSDVLMPYLRAANVQPHGRLDLSTQKEMWFSSSEATAHVLRAGDVVVVEGGQGGFGRAAFLEEDIPGWGYQNSINRLRPNGGTDGRFLTYLLLLARQIGYVRSICNVVSMPHFTAEKLARMPVPVVPMDEQREIADHLDRETAKMDALIAKAERFIELAQERRAALITAAVTGQIEIPTED